MYGITIKMLDPWGRESQKKGKQSTQINFCQTKCISWLTCFNGALVIMCGKLEFSKGWVWIFWQKTKGGWGQKTPIGPGTFLCQNHPTKGDVTSGWGLS